MNELVKELQKSMYPVPPSVNRTSFQIWMALEDIKRGGPVEEFPPILGNVHDLDRSIHYCKLLKKHYYHTQYGNFFANLYAMLIFERLSSPVLGWFLFLAVVCIVLYLYLY